MAKYDLPATGDARSREDLIETPRENPGGRTVSHCRALTISTVSGLGGDHSVTAPAVRGFCAANPDKRVGIINIDAHLDVRNFEHGPHNGTPIHTENDLSPVDF